MKDSPTALQIHTRVMLTPVYYQMIAPFIQSGMEVHEGKHIRLHLCTICGAMKHTGADAADEKTRIIYVDPMSALDPCQACLVIRSKYPEIFTWILHVVGFQKHFVGVNPEYMVLSVNVLHSGEIQ